MMTKKQLQRIVIEAILIVIISFAFCLIGIWVSNGKGNVRLQAYYQQRFSSVLQADSYRELSSIMIQEYPEINSVYLAYDSEDDLLGYIVDVTVTDDRGENLHTLVGIQSDGSVLTGISRLDDVDNPIMLSDEAVVTLATQLSGQQIPVALNSQIRSDADTDDEDFTLGGLNDGVYYAQALQYDSYGYIDYVEIEVTDGIITRIVWDAFNVDPTTENRSDASLSGAYTVSGENWATQSYTLCHELMELQDPELLAMKSDGTTEIVEGVTTNITQLVNLTNECIANSRAAFDKDDYFAGLTEILEDANHDLEYEEMINADGFIVYSFADEEMAQFGESQTVRECLGIEEVEYVDDGTQGDFGSSNDNGGEDGVIQGGNDDILTDSVDGLPVSEIRTCIEGVPGDRARCISMITAVNTAYKFLKEYLDWLA